MFAFKLAKCVKQVHTVHLRHIFVVIYVLDVRVSDESEFYLDLF